jgi:hypothetical protein
VRETGDPDGNGSEELPEGEDEDEENEDEGDYLEPSEGEGNGSGDDGLGDSVMDPRPVGLSASLLRPTDLLFTIRINPKPRQAR